jgi:hypothetical protein
MLATSRIVPALQIFRPESEANVSRNGLTKRTGNTLKGVRLYSQQ